MLNTITIMGRLTREIEKKEAGTRSVVNNTLACQRDYAPKGEDRETDFVDIVVFGPTADFIEKYLNKGDLVVAKGRLQIRVWTDKDGNKRRTAEVIADSVYPCGGVKKSAESVEDDDDEIPFA